MPDSHDMLFRTLADPTRRALFERLCREGEQTVAALTAQAGVSQPAVSKHLGVLRQAGRDWCATAMRAARRTTARSSAPWPRWSTGQAKWPGSGKADLTISKIC